jgi:hypothetical protein
MQLFAYELLRSLGRNFDAVRVRVNDAHWCGAEWSDPMPPPLRVKRVWVLVPA